VSSPDGFSACFRGKLSDIGILSAPATAVVTPQATPEVAPNQVATAPALPAAPTSKPAETAVPAGAPSFGLLRAEPDGSTVIAGSGTPGSEVEVYSNGDLLGKTKVEASGDWVFVPDAPLPTGGVELTLGQPGSKDRAAQSFVVVIDPDKKTEPLVVASVPGKASEVLQGLATSKPAAPATTAVATLDAPAAVQPAPEPTAKAVPVAEPATPPAAPAASAAAPAETPAITAAPSAVAAAPAAAPAVAAPVSAPPTIDAIEIDGSRNFFAGSGAEGATVRVYVDDKFIADAIVKDGRWLAETDNVLTKPSQRIRVDMLKRDSAEVESRAEVNFVVDLPKAAEPQSQVAATAPTPATKTPAAPAAAAPATSTAPATSSTIAPTIQTPTSDTPSAPTITTPTVEAPTAPPPAAIAAPSAPTVVPVVPAPVQEAAAPTAPVAPVTADQATQAAQPTEPAANAEVPTLVATQVGSADDPRFASGKAIIRRGDNLWTIARRVYGAGIKYTAIYDANTTQIRDPDRIYPGQVFDLPEDR